MADFDVDTIIKLGWVQGSLLEDDLRQKYCSGWEIAVVISHDCDVAHHKLEGEPKVEVICGQCIDFLDKIKIQGRHPRELHLESLGMKYSLLIHDRLFLPREILMEAKPAGALESKDRRILTEWLAKRYIRSAFPNSFDARWRGNKKRWEKLMKVSSQLVQGVYLRLSTLDELDDGSPYLVDVLVALSEGAVEDLLGRSELETKILEFWDNQLEIVCVEVRLLGLDEITLKDMLDYQRFDLDWISFDDGSDTSPLMVPV